MTNYVLVHGGYAAGWSWERVMPYLRENDLVGAVIALDLVGHGSRLSEKPENQITMEDYIDDVVDAIEKRNLRNVVLVGHSLAGTIIPYAAARVSDRIKRLIYISGMIPSDGKSVLKTVQDDFGMNFGTSDSKNQYDYRQIFCHFMDEPTIEWYLSRIGSEPPAALNTPMNQIRLPENMPVTYVQLTEDLWLTMHMQNHMIQSLTNPELIELESGHNAPISHPEEIARILLRYA